MIHLSIAKLIELQSKINPENIAITAPGRTALTYCRLFNHIKQVVTNLNAIGIGHNDRVAVSLPNSSEMAVAFLAIASGATCAPLNPAYRAQEFKFYLKDLNAKALIIQPGIAEPAREVAQALGIPVIELSPILEAEAGLFTLATAQTNNPKHSSFTQTDDVALVLHTSGTTSRPKIVPLTHSNLCASAKNIVSALNLLESDRCLNVMPLFHIHGLIGILLSSLSAGGSVVCTPGFYAPKFFEWVKQFHPTWYSAVPTMHQAILARAAANRETIADSPIRLIRSSSAPLPPQIMAELEQVFHVPVIESYGMTEASHQMASNPLPPRKRKPGSVGIASGPEIAIMDETGKLLSDGEVGEVVIRGANVTQGYENNLQANETAFTNDWFRTGDLGYLDTDNYLFLKGRIKEIINRGGEKISPREVDEALLDHPLVEQVVTFAAPDNILGEDVAAAIVLKQGTSATEQEIKEFVAGRLADFKIPRVVIFVDEIPKGPTGKRQRIGLAQKLGLTTSDFTATKSEYAPPTNTIEEKLVQIWSEVLGLEKVGIDDNFFDLGGDSILAVQIVNRIGEALQGKPVLPIHTLFDAPTIRQLAQLLTESDANQPWDCLVKLKSGGNKPALFLVHDANGDTMLYLNLARRLHPERSVYGLRPYGKQGFPILDWRIEQIVDRYIKRILSVQPNGPYYIGGLCEGGIYAYEVARQLQARGHQVGFIALLDAIDYQAIRNQHSEDVKKVENRIKHKLYSLLLACGVKLPNLLKNQISVKMMLRLAKEGYVPQQFKGKLLLFRATATEYPINETPQYIKIEDPLFGWQKRATEAVKVYDIPDTHSGILREPSVKLLANYIETAFSCCDCI